MQLSIFDRLRAVIATTLSIDEAQIQLPTQYIADLDCDSLDLVELQQNTEQEFNIDIPDAEAAQQKTVQDTVTYIQKRQQ